MIATDPSPKRPKRDFAGLSCPRAQAFVTIFDCMALTEKAFKNYKQPRRNNRVITVGNVEDVPPGRSATVELDDGTELALYNIGGTFYAIENFCPHRGAPLVDGRLCGQFVECDWHHWRFDLRTGVCLDKPDARIESYPVLIEDGTIKIII